MKIKIRRPRSCLAYFLWVFGILLSLVLLNNLYARVRISAAQAAAYELAGELGYTPADFLSSVMYHANVDIVIGSSVCKTKVVFVTPLDLPDFEARLLAARPGARPLDRFTTDRRDFYTELPLNVNGVSGRPDAFMTFPDLPAKLWFLARERPAMQTTIVEFFQTSQVPERITFGDRPIDGNIAVIRWAAGRYPIWVLC